MTDLLGLPGYKYLGSEENEYSITIKAEPESQPRICPDCGSINGYSNGRITRHYRDIESKGKYCGVDIEVQRYKCNDCGRTYYSELPGLVDNIYITERLFNKVVEECYYEPFTYVASKHGMNESMPRRIFGEYLNGMRKIWKPVLPKVLGIDEAHLAKNLRSIFVEIIRTPSGETESRVLELAPNKKKATVIEVLEQLRDNSTDRKAPEVVTIDFTQGYKNAVEEVFGSDTKIIIDHFHVQQLINDATSKAYAQLKDSMEKEWESLSEEERKTNLKLWRTAKISVRIFRTNKEKLTLSRRNRLSRAITLYSRFATLYECKEAFRDIFNAHTDRKTAEAAYDKWVSNIPDEKEYAAFFNVVKTIKRWYTEVFNFFEYGRYSNGAVESQNNTIKNINRLGRGYSYEVIRAKILYRTFATKRPVYKRVTTSKTPPNKPTFGFMTPGSFDFDEQYGVKTILESGYGVDIMELQDIVARAETFADIEMADVLTK